MHTKHEPHVLAIRCSLIVWQAIECVALNVDDVDVNVNDAAHVDDEIWDNNINALL